MKTRIIPPTAKWYMFTGHTGELLDRRKETGQSQIRLARGEIIQGGERRILTAQGYVFPPDKWERYSPSYGDCKTPTTAKTFIYTKGVKFPMERDIMFPNVASLKDFDRHRDDYLCDYVLFFL